MGLLGLSGLVPKRCRRTTIRVPGVRVADDLVDRDFSPAGPNELWCAGIKYVRTWQGWLYLGAVMDCYSRRVVGWSMRTDLEAELVVDALEMAIARRRPKPGLVHHSDQGSSTSRCASASAAASPRRVRKLGRPGSVGGSRAGSDTSRRRSARVR